jgi:3-oxoadipate enol-lactonase
MPTGRANGIDISYRLLGQGTRLVMSHGLTGFTEDWLEFVEPLASHHQLVLYDVRGHGRTSAPEDPGEYSLPIFAADQAALMKALNIPRAHVGGVSMGGMIATQFVLDYPQMATSFLLCDSTAGNDSDPGPAGEFERFLRDGFVLMERIFAEGGPEELHRRWQEYNRENDPHFADNPEPEERGLRRLTGMSPGGYVGANRAIRERPDLSDRLDEIKVPTLVLVGEWDTFLPCSRLAHERIPGSRFVLVRRSGHSTPTWRPQAFQRAVLDFLEAVEAGRDIAGEFEL